MNLKKKLFNLIKYSQHKHLICPPGVPFVKVTSLEMKGFLSIHTSIGNLIVEVGRSSYVSIVEFPKLVRYIFIESGTWSDFLI